MQSFQYKILNIILNCNHNLYNWKIIDTPFCKYCGLTDTVDHHLYYCLERKIFWREVNRWTQRILNITYDSEYSACEILFGIGLNDEIQNLVLLMGKWYINKTRSENNPLLFRHFVGLLKLKFETYDNIFGSPGNIERVSKEIQTKIKQIVRHI